MSPGFFWGVNDDAIIKKSLKSAGNKTVAYLV